MKIIYWKVFKVSRNCPQGVQQWEKHPSQELYYTSVEQWEPVAFEPHLTPLLPTPSRTLQKLCPKSLWPEEASLSSSCQWNFCFIFAGAGYWFSHPSPQPQVAEILFWLILQRGQVTKIEKTEDLDNAINQLGLKDIYKPFNLMAAEYTFYLQTHGTISRIGLISMNKTRPK